MCPSILPHCYQEPQSKVKSRKRARLPIDDDIPPTQYVPDNEVRGKFCRVFMLLRGIRGRLGVPWLVKQLEARINVPRLIPSSA